MPVNSQPLGDNAFHSSWPGFGERKVFMSYGPLAKLLAPLVAGRIGDAESQPGKMLPVPVKEVGYRLTQVQARSARTSGWSR
ncbi:hypothetical protein RRG08_051952 [Elysia crispata]|uniref:Uncharacterized protein n=1 Tax=Elysia crispata TaxID=231223 RepID=A0AAE0Y1Y5_9GAST|nr:hypothetical protein RRG08_051952 [Elysia crispata]